MKKLAIGCGIILLLLGIGAAGATYYIYRQARTMVSQFAELRQVPDIERDIRKKDPFTPPSSEELTEAQLERLLKVQAHIRQRLGARFAEMEQKYKALSDKQEATLADVPTLMAAYRDLAAAWVDAKRSQVEALNEAGLSLDEYRWIRDQAYRAMGVPFMDFDVGKIVEQISSGSSTADVEPGRVRGSVGPSGPEINRQLIEKFRKQFEENLPLASFGL
jgi:hypothetical protein